MFKEILYAYLISSFIQHASKDMLRFNHFLNSKSLVVDLFLNYMCSFVIWDTKSKYVLDIIYL